MNAHRTFDVLLPTYINDDPGLFEQALASIVSNTLLPNKIILVIDGPITEEARRIISIYKLKFAFIDVVEIPKNMGITNALNVGLGVSSAKFVVRCDADDINKQDRFEKLINYIDVKGFHVVGSFVEERDKNKPLGIRKFPEGNNEINHSMIFKNCINHMSVVFDRAFILSLGGYPDFKWREDYALWLKVIGAGGKLANIPDVLVKVSAGSDQLRRRSGFKHFLPEFNLFILKLEVYKSQRVKVVFFSVLRMLYILLPSFLKGGIGSILRNIK